MCWYPPESSGCGWHQGRYAPDRPCLFYPAGREWRSDMKIATSIVPWLSLWLYYYEVWLATGEWEGGGISHEPKLDNGDVSNS